MLQLKRLMATVPKCLLEGMTSRLLTTLRARWPEKTRTPAAIGRWVEAVTGTCEKGEQLEVYLIGFLTLKIGECTTFSLNIFLRFTRVQREFKIVKYFCFEIIGALNTKSYPQNID